MRIVGMPRMIALRFMTMSSVAMGICRRARLGDVHILRMRTTMTLVTIGARFRLRLTGDFRRRML